MDGLVILGIAVYLAYSKTKVTVDLPKLEKRKNPDFVKNENAFMDLYNRIMNKE